MNIRHVVLLALSGLVVINLSAMKRLREESTIVSPLTMSTVLNLGQSKIAREKQYFPKPKTIIGSFAVPTQQAQQTTIITPHFPALAEYNAMRKNIDDHNIKAIKKSLKEGIDINNCSFLAHAAIHNKIDIVRLFIQHGAKMHCSNSDALYDVKNIKTVQLLLDNGAYINTTSPKDNFNTPLIEHATKGNIAIVREFILHRADITLKNTRGQSAYDCACEYRQNCDINDRLKAKKLVDILRTTESARTVITNNFTTRFGQNVFSSLKNQQINGSKK